MVWTIEAKILPLAGMFGHMYLEVFGNDGQRISQINGIAVCRETGKTKAMGSSKDLLKAYMGDKFTLANTADASRDNHPHKGVVIFEGTEQEVKSILEIIRDRAVLINKTGVPYNLTKCNSNSVFSALIEVIKDKGYKINQKELKKLISFPTIVPGINNPKLKWVNKEAFNKRIKSYRARKSSGKK